MSFGRGRFMKKIVFLLLSIILITGCSVKYNLTINEDLTIEETAKLTGTNEFFANYYKTTKKNVIKTMLETYQDTLSENGYDYKLIEDKTPYVNVTKKHNSIGDFSKNSVLFNDYFDEVKYTENGNIKKLETVGFNPNNPDNPERFDIKELEIVITCPYKVNNHNAQKVNAGTNTYYYALNEESGYKILLEFDASKKFNPNEKSIILIIICLMIIAISWTIVYITNKRKK